MAGKQIREKVIGLEEVIEIQSQNPRRFGTADFPAILQPATQEDFPWAKGVCLLS
jgi:hypothetical protein